MAERWTKEQQQVLTSRGNSLLVSAAAGSGKTAVLVERILRLITEGENPPDIDHLLVLTFTNAAAAQMRDRIRAALDKLLAEKPGDVRLHRQRMLVQNAHIMTIHSFCLEVVRAHCILPGAQAEGLPEPGFRIADEGESALLKEEILGTVLEQVVSDEAYQPFREAFASGRDDRRLGEQIIRVYEYSISDPWPERWRERALLPYQAADGEALASQPWILSCLEGSRRLAEHICTALEGYRELSSRPGGPEPYLDTLEQNLSAFERIKEELCAAVNGGKGYDKVREIVLGMQDWGRLKSISKKLQVDEAAKKTVADGRKKLRELWENEKKKYLSDAKEAAGILSACYPPMRGLMDAVRLFSRLYAQAKRDQGIVDFSDLEHFALLILSEGEGEEFRPSPAAGEYARYFSQVMTDEYQDSNLVQEYILRAVSGGGARLHNRFMVGDVKQSIYRFRLARPELFLEKYAEYKRVLPDEEQSGPGEDHRIELHLNFRSRREVLGGVNAIFRRIMRADVGGVEYDADAQLVCGASFPEMEPEQENAYLPELHLFSAGTDPADGDEEDFPAQEAGSQEREALEVGRRIQELVGVLPVRDESDGALRPARWSDVAILLRSALGWMDTFARVLAGMGIPCCAGTGGDFFDTLEVRTVLAFLDILDNPYQDIPLAAVLRSPIGGFTEEELAKIRIAQPDCDYYTACLRYAKEAALNKEMPQAEGPGSDRQAFGERLFAFLQMLSLFREECALTPVRELLWRILDRTGYEDCVLAMPGGKQRRANLELLIEKAAAFEQSKSRGLVHFLRYMKGLKESRASIPEAPIAGEEEEAVRIMTIHKSKGLEFPVVFVCGLGRQFNRRDTREALLLHPVWGAGCRLVRRRYRSWQDTLLRRAIGDNLMLEDQGEELRVLYVAMTRAKEKLILTGTVKDLPGRLQGWAASCGREQEPLSFQVRRSAPTALDLIVPALLTHPCAQALRSAFGIPAGGRLPEQEADRREDSLFLIRTGGGAEAKEEPAPPGRTAERSGGELFATVPGVVYDAALLERLTRAQQSWQAQREHLRMMASIPNTVTVSELKRMPQADEEEEGFALFPAPEAGEEQALSGRGALSGAERGTLYHDFLEFLDYSLLPEEEEGGERKDQEDREDKEDKENKGDKGDKENKEDKEDKEDRKDEEAAALERALKTMLESLVECGKIQTEVRLNKRDETTLIGGVRAFLCSDTGRRMRRAAREGRLRRETSFLLGIPARRLRPDWDSDELVQVQGRIDAWFVEQGKICIVDYKTDRIPEGLSPEDFFTRVRHYDRQLEIYREALERLVPGDVKEQILYSFDAGREIQVGSSLERRRL